MSRLLLSSAHCFISSLELVPDTDYTAVAAKAQQGTADDSTALLVAVAKAQQDPARTSTASLAAARAGRPFPPISSPSAASSSVVGNHRRGLSASGFPASRFGATQGLTTECAAAAVAQRCQTTAGRAFHLSPTKELRPAKELGALGRPLYQTEPMQRIQSLADSPGYISPICTSTG